MLGYPFYYVISMEIFVLFANKIFFNGKESISLLPVILIE